MPAGELAALGADALEGLPVEVADSAAEAIEVARGWAARAEGRAVLVAGSVLLAGEAIAHARAEGWGIA